jgi:hypothetical protein
MIMTNVNQNDGNGRMTAQPYNKELQDIIQEFCEKWKPDEVEEHLWNMLIETMQSQSCAAYDLGLMGMLVRDLLKLVHNLNVSPNQDTSLSEETIKYLAFLKQKRQDADKETERTLQELKEIKRTSSSLASGKSAKLRKQKIAA